MNDQSEITAVPGFGFYPATFWSALDGMAQSQGGNISDEIICSLIGDMWDTGNVPGSPYSIDRQDALNEKGQPTTPYCRPLWDTITCIPGVAAGQTARLPCMKNFGDKIYDTSHNITRECLSNGSWAAQTNYSSCLDNQIPQEDYCLEQPNLSACQEDYNVYVFLLGYTVSLVALILAIFIFLYFKEMRCLRHKIHTNLFVSLLTSNLCWILLAVVQHFMLNSQDESLSATYCTLHIPLRYFHLTNFFWMFVEGLYLFLQVQASFTFGSLKLRHCIFLGWGVPLLITLLWSLLVYCQSKAATESFDSETKALYTAAMASAAALSVQHDTSDYEADGGPVAEEVLVPREGLNSSFLDICPFTTPDIKLELLSYNIPVFFLLACNTVFLVWIMAVVISKLRMSQGPAVQGPAVSDHFHLRATKALVVIVPLLGITYLITIVGPRESDSLASLIFIYTRSFLISFQGFFITLPYCFLNSEVCSTVKLHWERWQITRDLGAVPPSARNSVTAGFITACDNLSRSRVYTYQAVRSSIGHDRRGTDASQGSSTAGGSRAHNWKLFRDERKPSRAVAMGNNNALHNHAQPVAVESLPLSVTGHAVVRGDSEANEIMTTSACEMGGPAVANGGQHNTAEVRVMVNNHHPDQQQ